LVIPSAYAAKCGGNFNSFIADFSRDAAAKGISQDVISTSLGGVTQDMAVLAFDRRQHGTFTKTFEQYASTRVTAGRIRTGTAMLQRHAAVPSRLEQRSGGAPQILGGSWGLGEGVASGGGGGGEVGGRGPLAPRAHDCRRPELFQGELLAALQIVQRGDLPLRDLVGAYAGEIGQTQFLPSSYIKYGVDFDGNGHVDL